MIFVVFHPFCFTKSQVPTFIHSTHDMFSLFPYTILILSYLILSSYSVISDIKDNSVYSACSETRILRSTEGVLSTGKLPARQTPLYTCG